jgi:hypothetical protein
MANGDFFGGVEAGSNSQERASFATPVGTDFTIIQSQITPFALQLRMGHDPVLMNREGRHSYYCD